MCTTAPGFQYTVPVMLERFQQLRQRWWHASELAPLIVLPPIRDAAPVRVFGTPPDTRELDDLRIMIERRLLVPLHDLGLVRKRELPGEHPRLPRRLYRETPLFDRFIGWELAD